MREGPSGKCSPYIRSTRRINQTTGNTRPIGIHCGAKLDKFSAKMIAFPDKITEGRNHRRRRDGSRKGNFNRVTRKRQCQRDNTNVELASFCGSFRLNLGLR